ncbi:MAG: CorA family divalent cation transporter, partial [Patescibacteria group bacterium]
LVYLILHFPVYNIKKRTSVSKEVDFVLGRNFIITAGYDPAAPLNEFFKIVQADSSLKEKCLGKTGGLTLFFILKQLYGFSLREIDHIQAKIEKIEENIFKNKEKETVRQISFIKRDILDFNRIIKPHEMVLKSLEKNETEKIFGKKFTPYLNDIVGEYFKVRQLIENHKEVIDTLYTTNESLLSTKTNEVIKNLTIMAFLTFPLMLLSSIFGMNTRYLPFVGKKGDFWLIIAIMASTTLAMLFVFKKKKWL